MRSFYKFVTNKSRQDSEVGSFIDWAIASTRVVDVMGDSVRRKTFEGFGACETYYEYEDFVKLHGPEFLHAFDTLANEYAQYDVSFRRELDDE